MKHKKSLLIGCILSALTLGIITFSSYKDKSSVVEANATDLTSLYSSCESAVSNKSLSSLWSAVKTAANANYSSGSYDGLLTWYKTVYWDTPNSRLFDYYSLVTNFKGSESCGSYSGEGDCFNREHSIPKSWWGGKPDKTAQGCDIYIVIPTDGYVNNRRGNQPLGEVKSATYTSNSGFKLGSATGFGGTTPSCNVFEPLDSIKGDMARIYFYARAKWNSVDMTSGNGSVMFSGSDSTNYGLTNYAKAMLYEWHTEDPVDDWERSVNDLASDSSRQGNRNPFIDHPEYADYIWGDKTIGSVTNNYLNISDKTKSLESGSTTTVSATSSDTSKTIHWTTSNSSVVSLSSSTSSSGSNITLTAGAAGTATITATVTIDDETLTQTCTVTVTKKISQLSYTGSPSKTTYDAGESFSTSGLTVTVTYTDNTTDNVTSAVTWSPDPLTAGTTSVTGTYGGKTITINGLTVNAVAHSIGEKVTDVADIVSGAKYRIGATTSSTNYYFQTQGGTNTGEGLTGYATQTVSDAATLTFTGSSSSWIIQFENGNYLSLASSKNNGKYNSVTSSATWTITNTSSSLLNLKIGDYSLQKNNSTTNFGSYGGTQTNVWLELVSFPSSGEKTLSSISVKSGPTKTSYDVWDTFDPADLVITLTYSDNSKEDVTYSSSTASKFTFVPSTSTPLTEDDDSVEITYGGKSVYLTIEVVSAGSVETYTVAYNGNGNTGGTVPVDNNQYESGEQVTVKSNEGSLVKTGYTFAGWNTKSDGSGTSYATNSTFNISSNVTLYAKWNENAPVVTNSIKAIYDGGAGTYSFEGIYVGETYAGSAKYPIIMNGEYGILLYNSNSLNYSSWDVNSTCVKVTSASVTIFKNLYETTGSVSVSTTTNSSDLAKVESPKTYLITGDESTSDLSVANRLSHVIGTTYSINNTVGHSTSSWKSGYDNTVVISVGTKRVTVFIKKALITADTQNKIYNAVTSGDEITLEGFTSFYNDTFQVNLTKVVEAVTSYTDEDFAEDLLSLVAPVCSNYDGVTNNKNALTNVWTTLEGSNYYLKLSSSYKNSLKTAQANENGSTYVEKAMAFYDKAVAKYALSNFLQRTIVYNNSPTLVNEDNNVVMMIVIVSIVSISSIAGFYFLKRKKEQ